MKTKACVPCAKRKVRCNGAEPCSHCKRRKQDQCTYTKTPPNERIKQLEELVRSLGGSPETPEDTDRDSPLSDALRVRSTSEAHDDPPSRHGVEPVIVEENGEPVYLESCVLLSRIFHSLMTKACMAELEWKELRTRSWSADIRLTRRIPSRGSPIDLPRRHPAPQDAATLWDIFYRRVDPLIKISFDWELAPLRAASVAAKIDEALTPPDCALLFAVYFISIESLSDEECLDSLNQPRSALLPQFQLLCEQALAGSEFFCSSDIKVLQATTLYVAAGLETMSARSLWALMGLVVRNCERIGMHRDGGALGLSPYETERRRRIWWQLQHLDLALAVRSGITSLTLMADWDTKLPLNIEDEDINLRMRETPRERGGLTSMSHCLWTYWIIQEQRLLCRTDSCRFWLSWPSDQSWSQASKNAAIKRLEDGLNKNFLQYCDPIRPLDILVQIGVRATICTLRRLVLHPLAYSGSISDLQGSHRREVLDACVKCLEYDVAMHSNLSIRHFRWRTKSYFQWSALVYILIEACHQCDSPIAERLWRLLSDVYAANGSLSILWDDRRKAYAAELLIAVWNARERFLVQQSQAQPDKFRVPSKPVFLANLESRLLEYGTNGPDAKYREPRGSSAELPHIQNRRQENDIALDQRAAQLGQNRGSITDAGVGNFDMNTVAMLDFDEIDWSFWDTCN